MGAVSAASPPPGAARPGGGWERGRSLARRIVHEKDTRRPREGVATLHERARPHSAFDASDALLAKPSRRLTFAPCEWKSSP
jgi:hypothetical protein